MCCDRSLDKVFLIVQKNDAGYLIIQRRTQTQNLFDLSGSFSFEMPQKMFCYH